MIKSNFATFWCLVILLERQVRPMPLFSVNCGGNNAQMSPREQTTPAKEDGDRQPGNRMGPCRTESLF